MRFDTVPRLYLKDCRKSMKRRWSQRRHWQDPGAPTIISSMKSIIETVTGHKPGPTLAVFAGIHGNEIAGIQAVRSLQDQLQINAGTVHFVMANMRAIEQNVRYTEKNLNRCFIPGNDGTTYEDTLARQLMSLLDGCDALLDLHGYSSDDDEPFLIGEAETFELASKLGFSIISSGWATSEPGGTDGYMHSLGKIGLCAECGSNFHPDQYVSLAKKTIKQFLQHFGAIEPLVDFDQLPQKTIQALKAVKKQTDRFSFDRDYKNFDALTPGAIFARDDETEYRAEKDQFIIFPRANCKVGEEAFTIGTNG